LSQFGRGGILAKWLETGGAKRAPGGAERGTPESAGPRRRNAQLRWAMRGQDPLKEQRVPDSAGLFGDRTHSESNGCPGARRHDPS
jgi:hypothetical protein